MSRREIWAILAFTMMISVLLITGGCHGGRIVVGEGVYEHQRGGPPPWAPAHGYRAKHHYRYYPPSQVYLDVGREVYFYYDGGGWQVSAALPRHIRLDWDDYVTLEMDTDKPYQFHTDVVRRYPPGQLKKMNKNKGKWK